LTTEPQYSKGRSYDAALASNNADQFGVVDGGNDLDRRYTAACLRLPPGPLPFGLNLFFRLLLRLRTLLRCLPRGGTAAGPAVLRPLAREGRFGCGPIAAIGPGHPLQARRFGTASLYPFPDREGHRRESDGGVVPSRATRYGFISPSDPNR